MSHIFKTIIYSTFVILLTSSIDCMAKGNPWFPPTNLAIIKKGYIELVGGAQQTDMRYTGLPYPGLKRNIVPNLYGGIGYRYQIGDYFSIGGTGYYSKQGLSMGKNDHYILESNNIGLFIPIEYYINMTDDRKKKSMVFFQAGPYIAAPYSGTIQSKDCLTSLNQSNIAPVDLGFECGAGFRIKVYSLQGRSFIRCKLSYFRGLTNTFADNELNGTAESLNQPHYQISGNRHNQGFRVTASIEIPLKKENVTTYTAGGDGKKNYKKFAIIK